MSNNKKVSILIVDDRPENLTAMAALLTDPELELVTALSGNEALRHTLKTDFALVLLDVQMPEMDGFETAEWLRSNPKTRHLPIIFVTAGMKEEQHQFKGYEAGAVDYLMKPIEPVVLRGKVKVFCELARQRHELEQHEQHLEQVVKERTAALAATLEERHRLELQLIQSQRLESLGNLAGGVAHDINNVLAAILGLASINLEEHQGSGFLAQSMETIVTACLRGREVVKGLLYFARKDMDPVGPLDLNRLVKEIVNLLEATTLKRIRISTELQEPLGLMEGDASALSHALMNLCMNAGDAMPDGGSLELRTRRREDGELELRVRDTGTGMSPEVLKQAVDPFFTTKPVGKGTGLGLAMVYGTMKAHGGTLELHSEAGQGTEVVLRFPPTRKERPAREASGAAPAASRAGLRILLVDDDELIRLSIPPMLEALGHQVETAEGGRAALERLAAGLEVDLAILDMRMPGLSGAQTLPRMLELRPGLAVLLATGHSDQDLQPLVEAHPGVACIRKPFSLEELRDKLAEIS
jgi:signal transduction histidine kinase